MLLRESLVSQGVDYMTSPKGGGGGSFLGVNDIMHSIQKRQKESQWS